MPMAHWQMDWSARGRARVWALTVLGTAACIAFAFLFDSYSFESGSWRWGSDPLNNLLIPLILAPPILLLLLGKMRQLAVAHHELMTVASTDGLTSLLNRRAFTSMIDGYFERVKNEEKQSAGALLVLDVDHFKSVNDRFGHDIGDEALRFIARTVRGAVRETDLVGRMGGEEFGVFVPGLAPEQVRMLAERIRTAIDDASFIAHGRACPLSISIGGVTFVGAWTFNELYREADDWLYEAKNLGRNRVVVQSIRCVEEARQTVH